MKPHPVLEEYRSSIKEEKEAIEKLLSNMDERFYNTIFAYGRPLGDDIDLCFITTSRYNVDKLEEEVYKSLNIIEPDTHNYHIIIACLQDFFSMIEQHKDKAVEFRTAHGKQYLKNVLRRKKIKVPVRDYDRILEAKCEEFGFIL